LVPLAFPFGDLAFGIDLLLDLATQAEETLCDQVGHVIDPASNMVSQSDDTPFLASLHKLELVVAKARAFAAQVDFGFEVMALNESVPPFCRVPLYTIWDCRKVTEFHAQPIQIGFIERFAIERKAI
jgi:hypothetical protein